MRPIGKAVASVFLSSTSEDLKPYRGRAARAARAAGLVAVMMEDLTAAGGRPPMEDWLARVDGCDVGVARTQSARSI